MFLFSRFLIFLFAYLRIYSFWVYGFLILVFSCPCCHFSFLMFLFSYLSIFKFAFSPFLMFLLSYMCVYNFLFLVFLLFLLCVSPFSYFSFLINLFPLLRIFILLFPRSLLLSTYFYSLALSFYHFLLLIFLSAYLHFLIFLSLGGWGVLLSRISFSYICFVFQFRVPPPPPTSYPALVGPICEHILP